MREWLTNQGENIRIQVWFTLQNVVNLTVSGLILDFGLKNPGDVTKLGLFILDSPTCE